MIQERDTHTRAHVPLTIQPGVLCGGGGHEGNVPDLPPVTVLAGLSVAPPDNSHHHLLSSDSIPKDGDETLHKR